LADLGASADTTAAHNFMPNIVGIAGHRPDKVGGYGPSRIQDYVRSQIEIRLRNLEPKLVMTGMALGVDQWSAEIADKLAIPFLAAVPFEGQERAWPLAAQEHYHMLLKKAARVVIVSPGGYTAHKMQVRNVYIVDHVDSMIGVWNGTDGGTANCLRYAIRKDRDLWLIDPRNHDTVPSSSSGPSK
jgi:uncharacterized phage-like protein YoqJ